MKSFMNDFMNDNQDIAEDRQLEWRDKFLLACDNAFTVFGTWAYRRFRVGSIRNHSGAWESAINKALFDVIMFWFARYEKRQIVPIKDAIRERLIEMMSSDQDFIDSITLGTSDVSRVKLRFEKMKSALDGLVNVPASERRVFSLEEKAALYDQNPTCRFCGQRVESIDDADVDHQVRFAEGGSTSLTNAAIAHRYCNRAQKSRH